MIDYKTKKDYEELVENMNKMTKDEIAYERDQLNKQQERFDIGANLLKELSKFSNSMNNKDGQRGFRVAFKSEHRTLQQSMFRMFLELTYFIAEYKSNDVDLRNSDMVAKARQIKAALGDYGDSLPMI